MNPPDLVVQVGMVLERHQVAPLIEAVSSGYYINEQMVAVAIEHGSSFNLIHYDTGIKVDVFVLTDDPLDRRQMARRQSVEIADGVHIWVGTPEDQVLRKLAWFRAGGEVSDRQWRDVVATVRVQWGRLDLGDLLEQALSDANQS